MAAGGGAGVVTVWNLEDKRLHTVLRDAHDAPLLTLHFFAGEPLLMSSAADNSIKQWVFDGQDAQPRLLKFRSGHSAPPSVVQHYAEVRRFEAIASCCVEEMEQLSWPSTRQLSSTCQYGCTCVVFIFASISL